MTDDRKSLADLIIEHGPFSADRQPAWARRLLRAADVSALRDELIELRAIRERVARVEAAGSPVCDCDGYDSAPTSPRTGAAMPHHCDCAAVAAAAALLGDRDQTAHVAECGCLGVDK